MPWTGWAIRYTGKTIVVADEIIAKIRPAPTETLGWFKAEMNKAWKNLFPITPLSSREGGLPMDHPVWGQTPNQWWKFLTDTPLVSWEDTERLNRQRRQLVVPHFDESGWLIQERRLVDFRGMASMHMGNHPMLKLIQILTLVQTCDVLVC